MVALACFLFAAYFIIAYAIGGATLLAIAFSCFLYFVLWSDPNGSKKKAAKNEEENTSDLSNLSDSSNIGDSGEVIAEQARADANESIQTATEPIFAATIAAEPIIAEPIIAETAAENPISGDFCAVNEVTGDFESTSGFGSRFSSVFDLDIDSEFDLDLDLDLDSDLDHEADSWDNSWESGSIPRDQSPYWDIDDPYERGAMETRDSMQWWDTFSGDSFGDSFGGSFGDSFDDF